MKSTDAGALAGGQETPGYGYGAEARPAGAIDEVRPLGPRGCSGPGREGQPLCGKPTQSRCSDLCVSHNLQRKKNSVLQPLRTKTSMSTCIGPGQDGGPCGRRVSNREPGQDDGVCRTHNEQLKRRGFMGPIEARLPALLEECSGPGRDGSELCGRPAEARDTLLCSAHDRQHKKHGALKPIRKVNTREVPCSGPGADGALCGRPSKNKTLSLCGGHYAQHNRQQDLSPLKTGRKRGEATSCGFGGCRYKDAPSGEGYCYHHWRQLQNGHALTPLTGKTNRGKSVLDRDEDGNKLCNTCKEWKPPAEFSKASAARDGLNYLCRRCQASNRMKAKYGIDLDHYEALLSAQNGCCAICPRPLAKDQNRLAVDHDHTCCPGEASCGKCIRGLLCPNCNRALGLLQEDVEIIFRAGDYVKLNTAVINAAV